MNNTVNVQAKTEQQMKERLAKLKEELGQVRTGRANPQILDSIKVEYYGQLVPIRQVAAVSVPEPRTLEIRPWDPSIIGEIEKAIQKSDIGITPFNDSKLLRLSLPPMTEERRKDIAKLVAKIGEEYRVSVRNHRREAMEELKKDAKANNVSEDQRKSFEAGIQKLTDAYIKQIDDVVAEKQKEISGLG